MKAKSFNTIVLHVDPHHAVLKFNRPKAGNAYTEEMGLELLEALHLLSAPSVRSVVITGEGQDFCVGLDPEFMAKQEDEAPQMFRRSIGYLNQVVSELRRLAKPVIAAVNGKAFGTGFSFCLACDFILSSQDASYSCSYINLGLVPDGGLSYFLTRLVGPQKTAELVMTGKTVSARKALEMDIISGVVPPDRLVEEATNLALYFASGPTLALGKAKRLIDTAVSHSLEEQLEEERQSLIAIASSEDFKEGLHATLKGDKKPIFKGK
jgi:2-(1,2-epoxy-1,2-dihydrophenyl)acetyl-CoA isomerase